MLGNIHASAVAWVVCGLVWGIGLRRLGCVCGRRLGTGSCVCPPDDHYGRPRLRPCVSLSVCRGLCPLHLTGRPRHACISAERREPLGARRGRTVCLPRWTSTDRARAKTSQRPPQPRFSLQQHLPCRTPAPSRNFRNLSILRNLRILRRNLSSLRNRAIASSARSS